MSQSFLYTWLEWVYSNRLIPSAPPCSVFNDSLVPLNKVHTYDCRLRSSTVWLRPSLLHLYLMLPVYGPHVQKEETFTSHTLSFPASYDCFPTSLDLDCAVCAQVGLLFGTPWTVAPQTPLSMEFSRQGYYISYSRRSSEPRDPLHISWVACIGRQVPSHSTTWEASISNTYMLCKKMPQNFQTIAQLHSSHVLAK